MATVQRRLLPPKPGGIGEKNPYLSPLTLGPLDQILKEGRGQEVPVILSSVVSLPEHMSGSGGRTCHLCSGSLGTGSGTWVGVCGLLKEAG